MKQIVNPWTSEDRLLIRSIHFPLTDALRWTVREKTGRLFRLDREIARILVEIEREPVTGTNDCYTARAEIEIPNRDTKDAATGEDAFKAVDRLIDKLENALSVEQ